MSACSRPNALRIALLLLAIFSSRISLAQMTTGSVAGRLRDAEGQAVNGASIVISSELGFRSVVKADAQGAFLLTLPYGRYQLKVQGGRASASPVVSIDIEPLQNQELSLTIDA